MQIVHIIKTVGTTIDALIAIGCFAGSIYYAKSHNDRAPMIALLVISGLFIANAVIMWV